MFLGLVYIEPVNGAAGYKGIQKCLGQIFIADFLYPQLLIVQKLLDWNLFLSGLKSDALE